MDFETQISATVEDVLNEVCEIFNLSVDQIRSKNKQMQLLFPRYIISYVCYTLEMATFKKIGNVLERDHSSILVSNQKVKDWMDAKDPAFLYYWNVFVSKSKIWHLYEDKQMIHKYWIDSVKRAMANYNRDYFTTAWVHLETGKPVKKCRYELNKLIELGHIFKITSNLGVIYKLSNK